MVDQAHNESDKILNDQFLQQTVLGEQLVNLRKSWGWFVGFGIALILIGIFAATYILISSLTAIFVFGTLMFVGGFFQLAAAFQFRAVKNVFWSAVFSGILFLICGFIAFAWPAATAVAITILVGITLVLAGILRIVAGIQAAGIEGCVWMILLGVLDLLIAVLLFSNVAGFALILPGVFLACDLLFQGVAMLMIGLALKKRSV